MLKEQHEERFSCCMLYAFLLQAGSSGDRYFIVNEKRSMVEISSLGSKLYQAHLQRSRVYSTDNFFPDQNLLVSLANKK